MTRDEQVDHFNEFISRMADTMLAKGDDYANTDRLSNFKLAGNISGIGAKLNCLSLIATKVARLGVLLNSDQRPKYESIQDSILDLACYAALLSQILQDEDQVDSEGAG